MKLFKTPGKYAWILATFSILLITYIFFCSISKVRVGSDVKLKKTRYVLLLASQRVGSTFIGQIFNHHPQVMYFYEPLDSLYSHLYGTQRDWAVPVDIHYHPNGSARQIPTFESDTTVRTLLNIYHCKFQSVIPEFLISEFWQKFSHLSAKHYVSCLEKYQIKLQICLQILKSVCPFRLGINSTEQEFCGHNLHLAYHGKPSYNQFSYYVTCVKDMLFKIQQFCLQNVTNTCIKHRVRVVKTVRLSARTLVQLMQRLPSLNIIHLIRDPKAVANSRAKQPWAMLFPNSVHFIQAHVQNIPPETRLLYLNRLEQANNNISFDLSKIILSEAGRYCESTLDDIHVLENIEKQYQNSVFRVVYEQFIHRKSALLDKIYNFIGINPDPDLYLWLENQISSSKTIATNWKSRVTPEIAKEIEHICFKLYKIIKF